MDIWICSSLIYEISEHGSKRWRLNVVISDSPWCICASLTLRSVPPTFPPLFRRRTATSSRRSTMRSGCVTAPASCWPPAPRKTRPSKRRRTFRRAAPASWPTCQSCRGWRRPRSCKKWRGGRRTRGRWTIDYRAKEGWPSQASKRLVINCVCVLIPCVGEWRSNLSRVSLSYIAEVIPVYLVPHTH